MWSHYGQHHTGFVIGYDVNEPILGQQLDSVFNVEDGQVFFSPDIKTCNAHKIVVEALQWANTGMEDPPSEAVKMALRHILLLKQQCWRYENEIRVVKVLTNFLEEQHEWASITGNNFQTLSTKIAPMVSLQNSSLRLLEVAPRSIKHIILGMKNPLLQTNSNIHADADLTCIGEGQEVTVKRTTWSSDGHGLEAVEAYVPTWGDLNAIGSKKLSHSDLEAISQKLLVADAPIKQGMTLTTNLDGSVKAYWDCEL
jgi:hypothetical protein